MSTYTALNKAKIKTNHNNKQFVNKKNINKYIPTIIKTSTIFIISVLIFTIHMANLQIKTEIECIERKLSKIEQEEKELNIQITELSSPLRIQRIALKLGLKYPEKENIKYIKDKDSVIKENYAFNIKFNEDNNKNIE